MYMHSIYIHVYMNMYHIYIQCTVSCISIRYIMLEPPPSHRAGLFYVPYAPSSSFGLSNRSCDLDPSALAFHPNHAPREVNQTLQGD